MHGGNALLIAAPDDSRLACTTGDRHAMYITDLRHFLDEGGAIGPAKGPGRTIAQFQVDVIAHATNATGQPPAAAAPKAASRTGRVRSGT